MSLDQLVQELTNRSINEPQFHELQRRLIADPDARKRYQSLIEVEAGLNLNFSTTTPATPTTSPAPKFPPAPPVIAPPIGSQFASWASLTTKLVLAAIVGGAVIYFSTIEPNKLSKNPDSKPNVGAPSNPGIGFDGTDEQLQSVARITNTSQCQWRFSPEIAPGFSQKMAVGNWLVPGKYGLISGTAEIVFDSGAVITITGKSEFEIVNSNETKLTSGSLIADVPQQAIGFKVGTPAGRITDLSTRFGVDVAPSGQSDVFVLEGLVEAQPLNAGATSILVNDNSAIRMLPNQLTEELAFSEHLPFIFPGRKSDETRYIHFSFDGDEVARGKVQNTGSQPSTGEIISRSDAPNSWSQVSGRYGKAIFFSGKDAKVQTKMRGISGSSPRTIACWIRIPADAQSQHAYSFAGWGEPQTQEGKKWQISWNANREMEFGELGAIRTEFGGGFVIGSTDLRDGKWHHVASVFLGGEDCDVATHIRHYVDGKLEATSGARRMKINTNSVQKDLILGHYLDEQNEFFKGYRGWLDEFYLFDAALTPSQIVEIMNTNNPPAQGEVVPAPL